MVTKFPRTVELDLRRALERGKSILLLGPRQTGKTTLVEDLSADLSLSFLLNKTRTEFEKNPDLIISQVHALKLKKKIPLVIIDEIQKVPTIMDPIQSLIDKKVAQFVMTGSSARKLKQQTDMNLLPGRVMYFRLDPLNLLENPDSTLEDRMIYGGLPEVTLTRNHKDKEDYLVSYVETYLEEEIRKEALLRKLPDFVKFLELSALESGNVINYSSIGSEIGISHLTVKSYFDILESTLLGEIIQPMTDSSTRKKLMKSPRFLFFDLGVRRVAANEGDKLGKVRLGQIFEQFVGIELIRLIRSQKKRIDLNYWQDPQKAEVDWVLRKAKSHLPIEVKLKAGPSESDSVHLEKFIQEYSCPFGGFIVCQAEHRFKISENITALPWRQLPMLVELFK